jgi:hypothetical protein
MAHVGLMKVILLNLIFKILLDIDDFIRIAFQV